jgi:demethoxyubiquinone hydroxylase (CLK1/Coq7/Cat5 family)
MSLTDVAILMLINLLSFVIGAKIGQDISKKKDITLNPVKMVSEQIETHKEKKIADLEERKLKTMLTNIDNYDGTGFGQSDIPN